MSITQDHLPGVVVLERGWLSSNCIVFVEGDRTAVVDSGYSTHAAQTVSLVDKALAGRRLDVLVNTHLHSDHCGGNAALQAQYPSLATLVPHTQVEAVRIWDEDRLSYRATGQRCERFAATGSIAPGQQIQLGHRAWEVHSAPGHDPDAVLLFEPRSRILISADALWQSGFGVVFPELEGQRAFEEVGATLDTIEQLAPALVIPGHGPAFEDVRTALRVARERLAYFAANPVRHGQYAAKVLLKFKLLEVQTITAVEFHCWARGCSYLRLLQSKWNRETEFDDWLDRLIADLVRSEAAVWDGDHLRNN
ncbi:MBL fold metallo-hydrolase [Ramlibacter rhizophilus]|uniref:MBL fold metallo-hydrolase n=1 Tax=Ramlibacter rhizophilus TaxID=1781167 RepID=A0A4Z0BJG9_9BURK|nr:MBL fold metallo-hydrolase [Ramlibacter rhizophilus]TFY99465.1 MBL fold metallo-hydrolase [Ramlibacter rhizophilus]